MEHEFIMRIEEAGKIQEVGYYYCCIRAKKTCKLYAPKRRYT